jgi:predicted metal-dependent phosphoesterase TrpH
MIGGPYVDLHTHSTASDGTLPPHVVVESAHAMGLRALALTDHDTIAGLDDACAAGERLGIRVIRGCELSAHIKNLEVHLLVLHIESMDKIRPHLDAFQQQRYKRAREMVRLLNAHGIPLPFEDVLREADGGSLGRPHVARALLNAGYVSDLRESFEKYLGFGQIAYVDKPRLDAGDAIAIAHEAGALAIWAHPGKDGSRDRVKTLVADGLDGIEVKHPSHTPEDMRRLERFVTEYSLVRSGGSDWHGAREGFRTLGNMNVSLTWLEEQDMRLAERRAVSAGETPRP